MIFFTLFFSVGLFTDLVRLKNPMKRYADHKKKHRGMSLVHDWRDWLGGCPFEVASIERVESFVENLGFTLEKCTKPEIGFGNNQFVFKRK